MRHATIESQKGERNVQRLFLQLQFDVHV